MTIAYSLIAAFVVLPPMLVLWALYHKWRRDQDAAGPWDDDRDEATPEPAPSTDDGRELVDARPASSFQDDSQVDLRGF